jgi:hypothetical protein
MELQFSEIDTTDMSEMTQSARNETNYWEQPPQPKPKKKVSFDDILTNMNLVVNKQGVLQYMLPQQTSVKEPEVLDPSIQHTYIYNKYFKHYVDPASKNNRPKIPTTKEEYYQMLVEERKKRLELAEHVRKTKPKHLLLTSGPGLISQNIQASKNNLFKLNFR